jgi:acyl carrier protein
MPDLSRRGIEETLARFIFEELLELPYAGVDPLADQMVDSLGQEQLIGYIDEVYGVELTDEDMMRDNFESLSALSALISSRVETGPAGRASGAGGPRSDP